MPNPIRQIAKRIDSFTITRDQFYALQAILFEIERTKAVEYEPLEPIKEQDEQVISSD